MGGRVGGRAGGVSGQAGKGGRAGAGGRAGGRADRCAGGRLGGLAGERAAGGRGMRRGYCSARRLLPSRVRAAGGSSCRMIRCSFVAHSLLIRCSFVAHSLLITPAAGGGFRMGNPDNNNNKQTTSKWVMEGHFRPYSLHRAGLWKVILVHIHSIGHPLGGPLEI